MTQTALVVGTSGIVGGAAAERLVEAGWAVHGLARRPLAQPGVTPVAADLQDGAGLRAALAEVAPELVIVSTWSRQASEAENIRVNAAMVRNLLDALSAKGCVRHVALVTGLKHYLGPFEAYGQGALPQTPFREDARPAGGGELLLRPGGRGVRRRRAGRLRLERAPAPHRHRLCGGQRHEHGNHAGDLRHPVPGERAAVPLPGLGRAVERADRHDRRAPARPPPAVGGDHARGPATRPSTW